MSSHPEARRKLWGTLECKQRWGLSWRGRLAVLAILGLTGLALLLGIHPFLAITQRAPAQILVVEGWVHEHAIHVAAAEFTNGSYPRVFSTGGPVSGSGGYVNDFQTSASVGADLLKKVGVPSDSVHMVPSRVSGQDRTYSSAVALRDWLREQKTPVRSLNIVTESVHARRSRLLFQMAFGDEVAVGVIGVPSPDYEAARWWRYSEGIKEVISESAAYLYTRFLFHPKQ